MSRRAPRNPRIFERASGRVRLRFGRRFDFCKQLPFRFLIGIAVTAVAAEAQIYWDAGAGNNRWNANQNWSPNGVPGAGDDVILDNTFDANLPANLGLRGNQSVNSLTIDLNEALNIINGTGSRTLTITSGSLTRTSTSTNSHNLDMSTLELGNDSVMDIGGAGSLSISAQITGAYSVTKTGSGELIFSGANTFSGGLTLDAGTLTLTNDLALGSGDLTLAGGTLRLSDVDLTLDTLEITGDTIIDFAGTASSLSLSTLTISSGVTVTIENWENAVDFFTTTAWTGASYDTTGTAPMNQIIFTGWTLETGWQSLDNQVRPVPEPSTYGALLLAGTAVFFFWRRRRA